MPAARRRDWIEKSGFLCKQRAAGQQEDVLMAQKRVSGVHLFFKPVGSEEESLAIDSLEHSSSKILDPILMGKRVRNVG